MANIQIITNLYQPDELAGAALFTDLSLFLKQRGHDVRVLCTFSYYPAWKHRDEDKNCFSRNEIWQGIPVKRISMYVPERPSGGRRMLSDFSFFLSILLRNRFGDWKPDIILTASPMFSQCLAQRFIYPFQRIPRLIVVQDFVVDAALELGMLRFPLLKYPLRSLERWSFCSADTISTISDSMLAKLTKTVGPGRRLVLIPNWIHQSLMDEVTRQSAERVSPRKHGSLLYSGNLGVKQGLPQFLQLFTESRGDWRLAIHGGGAERVRLQASMAGMDWVTLGPVLPEREYVSSLLNCSACLVTQMPGVGANFLPSKLLPALAAGTPILAVCEPDSPLGREVIRGKFGEVVPVGDQTALAATLRSWSKNPAILERYSFNASKWAKNYSRTYVLEQYEAELLKLVSGFTVPVRLD